MDNFASFGFKSPDAFCGTYANKFGCVADTQVDPTCLGPVSVCG